jgi:hypothetical protein
MNYRQKGWRNSKLKHNTCLKVFFVYFRRDCVYSITGRSRIRLSLHAHHVATTSLALSTSLDEDSKFALGHWNTGALCFQTGVSF